MHKCVIISGNRDRWRNDFLFGRSHHMHDFLFSCPAATALFVLCQTFLPVAPNGDSVIKSDAIKEAFKTASLTASNPCMNLSKFLDMQKVLHIRLKRSSSSSSTLSSRCSCFIWMLVSSTLGWGSAQHLDVDQLNIRMRVGSTLGCWSAQHLDVDQLNTWMLISSTLGWGSVQHLDVDQLNTWMLISSTLGC